eukprot:336837-Amphidinium_carterae.1
MHHLSAPSAKTFRVNTSACFTAFKLSYSVTSWQQCQGQGCVRVRPLHLVFVQSKKDLRESLLVRTKVFEDLQHH